MRRVETTVGTRAAGEPGGGDVMRRHVTPWYAPRAETTVPARDAAGRRARGGPTRHRTASCVTRWNGTRRVDDGRHAQPAEGRGVRRVVAAGRDGVAGLAAQRAAHGSALRPLA